MVVAGMAAYTDVSKAHEIANEVRRVNKQLKEAQVLSATYNNRERLFGQPVTNVRNSDSAPIDLKMLFYHHFISHLYGKPWTQCCQNTVNWLLFVIYQFSPFSSVPSMTNLRTDEYRNLWLHENDS